MICLATDTIDDLILYLESEEKHALDFNISFDDDIFHDSKIDF